MKFWNGQVGKVGHWLKGFMVLPEYQNGSVGFAVLKEMLNHVEISGVMTVALPARRLFQAVGFVDCGVIPNYISVLRAGRVAGRIDISNLGLGLPTWLDRCARAAQKAGLAWAAGAMAGGGLRAWRFLAGSSTRLSTDLSGGLPSRSAIDDLWARARPHILAGAVRDGSFPIVAIRDARRSECMKRSQYMNVQASENSWRSQWCAPAVTIPTSGLRGIRVATVADVLFRAGRPCGGAGGPRRRRTHSASDGGGCDTL